MEKYIYTVGRRKTSTSTVRLFEGKGESLVNETPVEKVYADPSLKALLMEPIVLVNGVDKFYFTAKVKGGGKVSQIGAIKHALSRALAKIDPEYKAILKKNLLLRRDDRMVERKKTGLRKARKAPQYSKR